MRRIKRLIWLILLVMAGLWWIGQQTPQAPRPSDRSEVPARPAPRPEPIGRALTGPVDRILIEKSARRMSVFRDGQRLKSYNVALGFAPQGHKQQQGDGRTPEGFYRIDRKNDRSAFHLSLGIDYPRRADRQAAAALGVSPGGDIMIHGQPNQLDIADNMRINGDWTAGCIAVSNGEMQELFRAIPIGTEVEIRP
ncbi:MAG: L,D-transpeptidase family protein [Paracoccus sp. (in: a-proteobacteria)]|uniref:L,D-transpeptidase family protein n=1 Tax=Paracoccus sp. TaxID=267 RepID=UPI0026E0FC40|nr:L,D-transpeptidase family protein [Paracoccus sp. (in: a-proteobacteria)]MDO5622143.1 L,D-transpeptidase family protein [Paracoccus sp. (in: a-proteobacteria)]